MRKHLLFTSAGLVLLLVMSGCGALGALDAADAEETPEPSPEPTARPTPEPSPTPGAEDYLEQADELVADEDFEGALQALDRAIELEPDNVGALNGRASVLLGFDDPQAALADYDRVVELSPSDADAHRERGFINHSLNNTEEALVDFDRAIELGLEEAELYSARGDLHLLQGDFEQAMQDYQEAEILGGPRLLLGEDFTDPALVWGGFSLAGAVGAPEDGNFFVEINRAEWLVWNLAGVAFDDVTIDIDTLLEISTDDNGWGLICRYEDADNFYHLAVGAGGGYGISAQVDGEWDLLYSGFSPAINIGDGAENHLTVSCIGDTISLTVNGELLREVEDNRLSGGDLAISGGTFENAGSRVVFDNLLVRGPAPGDTRVISADTIDGLFELRSIEVSASLLQAGDFAPNRHHAATFGFEPVVRIVDADTGEIIRELEGHNGDGFGLAYSPDGTQLLSGGRSNDVRIWDVDSGLEDLSVSTDGFQIYDAAWSPDGENFAVVSNLSDTMVVFDSGGDILAELEPANGGWLWAVAYSQNHLVTTNDATSALHVYDSDSLELEETILYSGLVAAGLEFSPDETLLVSCHRDGTVNMWDTEDWSRLQTFEGHGGSWPTGGCFRTAFSSDGDVFFTVGGDGWLYAWDAQTGAQLWSKEFGVFVWGVSVSGDGELVMVALDDGTVRILGLP